VSFWVWVTVVGAAVTVVGTVLVTVGVDGSALLAESVLAAESVLDGAEPPVVTVWVTVLGGASVIERTGAQVVA
jgi:hypothetical protein